MKKFNSLFRTYSDFHQASEVHQVLKWRGIIHEPVEVIETDAKGNAKLVYNIYIDKKDSSIAEAALKEAEKHRTNWTTEEYLRSSYKKEREEERKRWMVETKDHFLEHLGNHFIVSFIKILLGGPPI